MIPAVKAFIERPLMDNMLCTFVLALGFATVLNLKRQTFPNADLDQVMIGTYYPGASPEDVEVNVTKRVESAIESIEGIKKYNSRSMNHYSNVLVSLDAATDRESAVSRIREAVNGISDFPDNVETTEITEFKIEKTPILHIGFSLKTGSEETLREHFLNIKRKIESLEEDIVVLERGERSPEYQIQISKEALLKHHVSFDEVIAAIKTNNIRLSAGTVSDEFQQFEIVTNSEPEDPSAIGDYVIRSAVGRSVRVKDVAEIVSTFSKKKGIYRYNGNPGMGMFLSTSADNIRVS